MEITFGSLFAGIGGMDLGLERAGMKCQWQVEIEEYPRKVLAKHWPNVRRHDDVRTFPPTKAEEWKVDVIAGGFPCQDISNAGLRAGITGERSGLWKEYVRIIRLVRPRFVIVENVAALLVRGMDTVLGDLASCGYDAEWDCIPAAAVGALHLRKRMFVLAYPRHERICQRGQRSDAVKENGDIRRVFSNGIQGVALKKNPSLANADSEGLEVRQVFRRDAGEKLAAFKRSCGTGSGVWATEPAVGRVADGIPNRVQRIKGLGNAVVPQVAEYIGRLVIEAIQEVG